MIKQFINKVIKQYSEHLKNPGNKTLGTLPNDWELELQEMLEKAFEAGRKNCKNIIDYEEYEGNIHLRPCLVMYNTFEDYLETLESEQNS